MGQRQKVAVIDDDPTGTQTVRDVPLITRVGDDDLDWAFRQADPTFAVLTNSRARARADAVDLNRTIGRRLAAAAQRHDVRLRCISRSDSTLRGHFPAEVEALAAGLQDGGIATDLVVICPAYPEAGRVTCGDTHYVVRGHELVPVAETEFARDATFGFQSSDLKEWVRERAGAAVAVGAVSLGDVREGDGKGVAARLIALREDGTRYAVANAVNGADLAQLAAGIEAADARGVRSILRAGPSMVAATAGQTTATPLTAEELGTPAGSTLLVVGSHTEVTNAQLEEARRRHGFAEVPLDVAALLGRGADAAAHEIKRTTAALAEHLRHGDAALVTSREVRVAATPEASLDIAGYVAGALVEVVRRLPDDVPLGCLVAKGGITSHDMAVEALGTARATVVGQLFTGRVSVWELGEGSRRPGLRFVVFPGNVGDASLLADALDRLAGEP